MNINNKSEGFLMEDIIINRLTPQEIIQVKTQAAKLAEDVRIPKGSKISCKNRARVRIRKEFKNESGEYITALAWKLCHKHKCRWFSYCLLRYHLDSFQELNDRKIEGIGQNIDNKTITDSFARILAGLAWLKGLITDELIKSWTRSENPLWRRAALVSTVALNVWSSDGGAGDTPRTLAICKLLVDDNDKIVHNGLSLVLRALAKSDSKAVRNFLAKFDSKLTSDVKQKANRILDGQ